MPFSVAKEHIQFFNHHLKIEFENLLNLNQLKTVLSAILFPEPKHAESLKWGFDLWRRYSNLKSILCNSKFATIAGQLKNRPELRFGFSQYLSSACFSDTDSFLYRKSCIKNLICGLCLCIMPSKELESPFFPTNPGAGLFFDIDSDFYLKFPQTTGKYFFIFYADPKARFYLQEEESEHQACFKQLGYQHGDFLNDETNPLFKRIVL